MGVEASWLTNVTLSQLFVCQLLRRKPVTLKLYVHHELPPGEYNWF